MEEGVEVADKRRAAEAGGLVLLVPCPCGGADAAGEGTIAGDAKVAGSADALLDIDGLEDAAAILMGDDGGEGGAVFIHDDPCGGHDGEGDGIDGFCLVIEAGDGAGDGVEHIWGEDLDAACVVVCLEEDAGGLCDGFFSVQDAGDDGGGADVEG